MIANVFLAIGLVLLVEGLVYALAPWLIEVILESMRRMPMKARRLFGLFVMVVGIFLLTLAWALGAL